MSDTFNDNRIPSEGVRKGYVSAKDIGILDKYINPTPIINNSSKIDPSEKIINNPVPVSKDESKEYSSNNDLVKLPNVSELSPELVEKYSNTAKWMGTYNSIDGGIRSAQQYEYLMNKYKSMGKWGSKVGSLVTGILGSSKTFGDNTKVPAHHIKALSELSAVRWTLQNNGIPSMGVAKQKLLDELLYATEYASQKAERLLGADPGRLPGDEGLAGKIYDTVKSTINGGIKGLVNSVEDNFLTKSASNRPRRSDSGRMNPNTTEGIQPDIYTQNGVRKSFSSKDTKSFSNKIYFLDKYVGNSAMNITLTELADADPLSINNLTDLKEVLSSSSNGITTSSKLLKLGNYGLDSNHNWEITFEPLGNNDMSNPDKLYENLNGGVSFLPKIEEINIYNNYYYRIQTEYSKWLPFTSFELQTRKSTQKSVGLFDGEISFPVSMEYTNELRLTIADDQCKSFRTYFNKCNDVALYYSEYDKSSGLTFVDKKKFQVAMYKNITFLCNIYILKGDLATVTKYPLLLVLRDYQEEYSGDTDSSATELALHFSIVGELNGTDIVNSKLISKSNESESPKVSSNNTNGKLNTPTTGGTNISVIGKIK